MKGALVFGILLVPAAIAQQIPVRPGSFREQARVERVVVDVYVTDARGDPVPDLMSSDFRVRVDGKPVPLESIEWVAADVPEAAITATGTAESAGGSNSRVELAPGRLLIFFFQTDLFVPSRLVGAMRMGLQAKRFLDTLLPTDRVAVLSFDSHLKLRQDFTSDREKLEQAIEQAILTGPPPLPVPEGFPSLARHFDFWAAQKAVTPEKALALISRAAAPIPGGKSMLFFGWGLGTIGGLSGPNPKETRDYREALPALAAARISIFTLDVTDADYHSLEVSLEHISDLTGGVYQKTHIFPRLAIDRVRRAIAGRYVLVFVKPIGPRGDHSIHVELVKRKAKVLARAYYQD